GVLRRDETAAGAHIESVGVPQEHPAAADLQHGIAGTDGDTGTAGSRHSPARPWHVAAGAHLAAVALRKLQRSVRPRSCNFALITQARASRIPVPATWCRCGQS